MAGKVLAGEEGKLYLVEEGFKTKQKALHIDCLINLFWNLEDLAHSEEGEVDIWALHGLEVVYLLVLLVIYLVKKLLPVVTEVIEKFIMVDHLGLNVKKHGGGLAVKVEVF